MDLIEDSSCIKETFLFYSRPLLGGALVEVVGFPRLMVAMGIVNLLFAPLLLVINPSSGGQSQGTIFSMGRPAGYERFQDDDEVPQNAGKRFHTFK